MSYSWDLMNYSLPLSMGFSRQECWNVWPLPSPGDLPNPRIKPESPALQADSSPTELPGQPLFSYLFVPVWTCGYVFYPVGFSLLLWLFVLLLKLSDLAKESIFRLNPLSFWYASVQFSSVPQLCPTLCDPMHRSTPGLPVHHQLPELTQTHAHRVRDAIQPSHPLSSPSPPAPNPSQHQSLFQWVNSSHEVA